MKKVFEIIIMLCIALISKEGIAQRGVNDLNVYMQKVRVSKYEPVPENLLSPDKKEKEIVAALVPYLNDSIDVVKERAYFILKHIGQRSNDQSTRKEVVSLLSRSIRDKNSSVAGTSIDALCIFNRTEFSDVTKDSIANALEVSTPHLDRVIKLAGYLGLDKTLGKLNEFSASAKVSLRWASILARARMNDREAISYIMNKLNIATVNDDFVYDIVPDLIYTRQKEIFSFLDQIIESDKPSCSSANPDSNEKIRCGYRVMELMAPVVAGLPLKMDTSRNLAEADYQKSLERLRVWIHQNPEYKLLDNSF